MNGNGFEREYFEWMYRLVCGDRYGEINSYKKLLSYLHDVEFTYIIPKDANRAEDGIDLRYRFTYDYAGEEDTSCCRIMGPCSVFEMLVALAIRCEETIMDDPNYGNRTAQWFWRMINNLGLGSMTDKRFDKNYVDDVMFNFLNRRYSPDGRGGLFTIRDCDCDLRRVEIWLQLLWYLDTIT